MPLTPDFHFEQLTENLVRPSDVEDVNDAERLSQDPTFRLVG
jgi:hypothetical protein